MANIKTRERSIGSIKTIDRASVMTQHIRKESSRLRIILFPTEEIQIIPKTMLSSMPLKSAKQEHEEVQLQLMR